jgi:hypothetical protein
MSVPLKSKLGCNHLIIGELQPNRLIFNMSVQMRLNPLLQPAPRAHFAEFQISKIIGVDTV